MTSQNPLLDILVLDIDQTLLTGTAKHDVTLRPGLADFLERTGTLYTHAVWTAASPEWASLCLNAVFHGTGYDLASRAAFIWTRERCSTWYDPETQRRELHKPLAKVWRSQQHRRERTLAVDDLPGNFRTCYGNYVRIEPFHGDSSDTALSRLATYLEELHAEQDFRRVEKRGWASRE